MASLSRADELRAAGKYTLPATIALGTSTFTMSALPGTPAIQNAIPMPFFGTTAFAAPGLGVMAALIMFGFGMWFSNSVCSHCRSTNSAAMMPTASRICAAVSTAASSHPPTIPMIIDGIMIARFQALQFFR